MKTKRLILILMLLVVILGATTFYLFYKNSKLTGSYNSTLAIEEEAKTLALKVGKLIVLPIDEVPTIATLSDPKALKNQTFFVDAKKGDKVLIYTNNRKAILYDPVANKVINVTSLNIGTEKAATPASTTIINPATEENKF